MDTGRAATTPRALRAIGAAIAATVLVGLAPGTAAAAPGNGRIADAQAQAAALEQRMAEVAGRLAAADAAVEAARATSVLALDQFQATQTAYEEARARAEAAAAAAAQATADLAVARDDIVAFARRSYMDGSSYPGAAALLTAGSPAELIERAVLLESAGLHRSDVLVTVTVLQRQATESEALARETLVEADALQARAAAELQVAEAAEVDARAQAEAVAVEQVQLETELAAAQQQLATLVGEAEAAARVPAPAPVPTGPPAGSGPGSGAGGGGSPGTGSASAVEAAIAAARQHLGVPYAWGGGGTSGPGWGWGVDDGVFGFDCSGLTQYAYARAGIAIPRNSRAQYAALPKVSADQLQRGDLVFWGTDPSDPGAITHVAIYLGGGQVIQAPQSGDVVKISPMWWKGYTGAVRPSA